MLPKCKKETKQTLLINYNTLGAQNMLCVTTVLEGDDCIAQGKVYSSADSNKIQHSFEIYCFSSLALGHSLISVCSFT